MNYLDICEYLQRAYQNIGIEVTIDLMPTATLRQAKSSGNLEGFRASWIADYPDAENYLSLFNFSQMPTIKAATTITIITFTSISI